MKICLDNSNDKPIMGHIYRFIGDYYLEGDVLFLACSFSGKAEDCLLINLETGKSWSQTSPWGCQQRKDFVDVTSEYCLARV